MKNLTNKNFEYARLVRGGVVAHIIRRTSDPLGARALCCAEGREGFLGVAPEETLPLCKKCETRAKAYRMLPLLLLVLLTACGKDTSCRILPVAGTEKPVAGNSCPQGQVVTGISGSVLTCAEVSVLCPTKE